MLRRITVGALAALLLVGGTLTLVAYVRSAEARAMAGEELADVLVLTGDVAAGTPSQEVADRVRSVQVPVKVRAVDGVSDLSELDGLVASTNLVAGEQVIRSRFVRPEALGVAPVPEGMISVTVALAPERALGGQLRPGDSVALIASLETQVGESIGQLTRIILGRVSVIGVQRPATNTLALDTGGGTQDDRSSAPDGDLLVTLAVDPASAQRVIFAAEHGTIWLGGQPDSTDVDASTVVTLEDLTS